MKKNLLFSVLFMFFSLAVFAQSKKVTGKVTSSDDGTELPGVSVTLKGTGKGTQTAADGTYSIDVPSNGGTLVFSFVGMTGQEKAIGNKSVINVALDSDTKTLSEVVVTGAGSAISKRDLAFDVQAVKADELPKVASASIDQALVGKIAGAQIQSTGGMPGQDVSILLRGINTLNRGTNPMILLDGVQLGATNLGSIDLNTIERVEVVQGAAAATIYGAQGANGVIQLFSKKGKSGKVQIDFSSSVTSSQYLNVGNLRKADMHGFVTDASNNVVGGSGKPLTLDPTLGEYSENLRFNSTDPTVQINKPYGANLQYYDHFKMFFVPTTNYNGSLTISGGNDKSDFAIMGSYTNQNSNFRDFGGVTRYNLGVNLGTTLAKGLTLRSVTQLGYTDDKLVRTPGEYDSDLPAGRNIIYTIFNSRPFANYDYKTADGNYPAYFGDAVGVNGSNPSYWLQYSKNKRTVVDLSESMNLNYKFPKFVELDAKYGLNYRSDNAKFTFLNQTGNLNANDTQYWVGYFNGSDLTGETSNWTKTTVFQNFLANAYVRTDFQKDFGLNIPIKTITQAGFDYRNTDYSKYTSYGLTLPTYEPYDATQTVTQKIYYDYKEPFVTYGYLVNQRFEYGDIAGISGGFRTDFSSAFGSGSTPNTFPRGDGFLRLSGFDFWKNSKLGTTLDEFKLRAAYGEAGIQPKPFDRYVTLGTRTVGASNTFYYPLDQPNPNLNVEISKELEFGADMGLGLLKGNWLSNAAFSITYWKRSTDNAIYRTDAAPSTGTGTVLDNSFSLASHGIQASLNLTVYKSRAFKWNSTINFGKQTSEITAVKGGGEVVVLSGAGSSGYVLRAGEKVGQLFGFVGIHSVDALLPDGTPAIPEAQRSQYSVASNGWVVKNATKAPYFSNKMYSFGDPNPKFILNFINNFSYKNIVDLGIQVDWVSGNHLYNQTKEWMYRDGIHSDYQNPITINGETGAWSAFYRGVYAEVSRNGTKNYFYEDASFVRLRNINISVDMGNAFHIAAFRHLKLQLSGRNLLTFTKYTGMDPEISSGSSGSAWDRGVDHNTMPNLKQYTVGLNLGF